MVLSRISSCHWRVMVLCLVRVPLMRWCNFLTMTPERDVRGSSLNVSWRLENSVHRKCFWMIPLIRRSAILLMRSPNNMARSHGVCWYFPVCTWRLVHKCCEVELVCPFSVRRKQRVKFKGYSKTPTEADVHTSEQSSFVLLQVFSSFNTFRLLFKQLKLFLAAATRAGINKKILR